MSWAKRCQSSRTWMWLTCALCWRSAHEDSEPLLLLWLTWEVSQSLPAWRVQGQLRMWLVSTSLLPRCKWGRRKKVDNRKKTRTAARWLAGVVEMLNMEEVAQTELRRPLGRRCQRLQQAKRVSISGNTCAWAMKTNPCKKKKFSLSALSMSTKLELADKTTLESSNTMAHIKINRLFHLFLFQRLQRAPLRAASESTSRKTASHWPDLVVSRGSRNLQDPIVVLHSLTIVAASGREPRQRKAGWKNFHKIKKKKNNSQKFGALSGRDFRRAED